MGYIMEPRKVVGHRPRFTFTIDTGTTNTRVALWDEDERLVGMRKKEVGVRDTAIDGGNGRLRAGIRECLEGLLEENGLTYDDVACVAASGMITSNVGLVEIPHLTAPTSADDAARGVREVCVPDVCPLPICFVPGVKNSARAVTLENFEGMDIMRGEEVETFALLERFEVRGGLVVLPGSHTKFVCVDGEGRISGCLTSITGELVAAVTNDTIIADAVGRKFVQADGYDRDMLLLGCETARRVGMGRACFSARILSQFAGETPERLASYILGVCLQSDVAAVRGSGALRAALGGRVIVAGKAPLARAVADVLENAGDFESVRVFEPEADEPLSARGVLGILRRRRAIMEG